MWYKMKIRNGFVSNSSSSSFLIYGIIFTEELKDIFSERNPDEPKLELCDDIKGLEIFECLEDMFIGKSWDNIKMMRQANNLKIQLLKHSKKYSVKI